jgi:excisionase family DNA binding protein
VSRPTNGARAVGQETAPTARGRYLTLRQAAEEFPAFSPRLLRRLVQERRLPFSRAGRCIVIAEADIHAYLERNRVEPPRWDVAS